MSISDWHAHNAAANRNARQPCHARARKQIIHDHRADALRAEVNAWQDAQAVGAYCAALREAAAAVTELEERRRIEAWIGWALAHSDSMDPLQVPSGVPEDPEITDTMLAERLSSPRWARW